jgi:hypothetical protein
VEIKGDLWSVKKKKDEVITFLRKIGSEEGVALF